MPLFMMSKIKSASPIKRVLIFGLGAYAGGSGSAAALYFAKRGDTVRVTDLKPASQLHQPTLKRLRRYRQVSFVLGKHRRSDVAWADVIVRNPGAPDNAYIQLAKQLNKPITNDVGVFLNAIQERLPNQVKVIGITGTRGKSTTTTLIYTILQAKFSRRVHLGGNIGYSPLLFLKRVRAGDIVVLEMSSWLLRDVHQPKFHVAVVTNLLRDHMNYYSSMKLYQADKERIFLGQTTTDYAVINASDSRVLQMAKRTKAKKINFTLKRLPGVQLLGEHNQRNVAAAWAVGTLFGVPAGLMTRVIQGFTGVPNRLEKIRTVKGRTFYNDTTATTPDATIAALLSFKKKIILIAGGNTKKLSLRALAKLIPQKTKALILLPGNASADFPPGIHANTMRQAVREAWALSKPGDVIVLSPGVTWLPVMNEFERGKQFVKYVKALC